MTLVERIKINIGDIKRFGPQFMRRHVARLTKTRLTLLDAAGQRVYVRAGQTDAATVRQIFGDKQYNVFGTIVGVKQRIDERYQQICSSGFTPVIVDAGANIGAASLWFKRHYPAASVVAIEPEGGNFAVLRKNAGLVDGIRPVQAAVGATPGSVTVKHSQRGIAIQVERATEGLPIITMEQAFRVVDNGVPFIAKVDIEGFESDLFAENVSWLADVFVVHIEPHDWMLPGKGTSLAFQKAIAKHDFEMFLAGDVITYVRLVPS